MDLGRGEKQFTSLISCLFFCYFAARCRKSVTAIPSTLGQSSLGSHQVGKSNQQCQAIFYFWPSLGSSPSGRQTFSWHRRRHAPPLLSHRPCTSPSAHPLLLMGKAFRLDGLKAMRHETWRSRCSSLFSMPSYPASARTRSSSPCSHSSEVVRSSTLAAVVDWFVVDDGAATMPASMIVPFFNFNPWLPGCSLILSNSLIPGPWRSSRRRQPTVVRYLVRYWSFLVRM